MKNAPALRKGLSLTISGIPWKASYQWLRRESKEAVFDLSNIVRRRVQISEQIALSHESSIQAGQDFVSRSRPMARQSPWWLTASSRRENLS
jgi:hypothetical protein